MIDKLSSLPTDNIYKLGTFGALALVVIGIAGPLATTQVFFDRMEKVDQEAAHKRDAWSVKHDVSWDQLFAKREKRTNEIFEEQLAVIGDGTKLLMELRASKRKHEGDQKKIDEAIRDFEIQNTPIEARLMMNGVKRDQHNNSFKPDTQGLASSLRSEANLIESDAQERKALLKRRADSLDRACILVGGFGLIILYICLNGWMFRHQRLKDAILRAELKKAELEIEERVIAVHALKSDRIRLLDNGASPSVVVQMSPENASEGNGARGAHDPAVKAMPVTQSQPVDS